jgi:hypothetical protein
MRSSLFGLLILVACGGGRVRGADAPLSPEAARVTIVSNAEASCRKLGRATAIGEDLDGAVADAQATNAAKEETAKLGGDTAVIAEQTSDVRAGSGGTVQVIKKTVEVYACGR